MITFKKAEFKKEIRTIKQTDFSWEYKLDYFARYDGERLTGITKHETKYFGGPAQITGGKYMKAILRDSNTWKKAKLLIETQGVDA